MLNPLCCETPRHCSVRHSTSSQITDVCFAAQRVSQVKTTFKPLQLLVSLMSSCWICIFPNWFTLVLFSSFGVPCEKANLTRWRCEVDQRLCSFNLSPQWNVIVFSWVLRCLENCHCTTISPYKFENASLNLLTLVCSNMDGTTAIYQSRFCKFR